MVQLKNITANFLAASKVIGNWQVASARLADLQESKQEECKFDPVEKKYFPVYSNNCND